MLGKTAGGLYWMSRYLERMENMARMVEAGQRLALTRTTSDDEEWASVLQSAGTLKAYKSVNNQLTSDSAIDWMLRNRENPSSILSSTEAARTNAKLVRTALTREVWESVNAAYFTLKEVLAKEVSERDLPAALAHVRQGSSLIRGAMMGTMMRNDIFNFLRLGTFVERADNTARILDVKYYVLLPVAAGVGTSLDNVQWQSILQSVSGLGGYRLTYGQTINASAIAQFLIRDGRMPRSLAFCADAIYTNLSHLEVGYDAAMPSSGRARTLHSLVSGRDVSAIIEQGLHEFLVETLEMVSNLGVQIEEDYRFHV